MMEERGRKGVDLWNRFFLIPTLPRDGGSSVIGSINQDSIRRHYSVLDPRSLLSLSPRGREENASIHACRSYTNVCVCVWCAAHVLRASLGRFIRAISSRD